MVLTFIDVFKFSSVNTANMIIFLRSAHIVLYMLKVIDTIFSCIFAVSSLLILNRRLLFRIGLVKFFPAVKDWYN